MFSDILKKIVAGENLYENTMADAMEEILAGRATDAQIGALMAGLAAKGETFEELAGAARAMRKNATRIHAGGACFDTCGTGGDGLSTFNISTITAFVVAAGGVTVAKHGNRSVSSTCGSADVLEALGVDLSVSPDVVEEAIAEVGIGFLFAPTFHGAMRHAAAARKETGLRSIFNMVGPLTNPAGASRQLLGVYAPHLTEMFAEALRLLGTRRALVVHGHDGLDEISVCAPTRVTELNNELIRTTDIDPTDYFGELAPPDALKGGSPEENARIARDILSGDERGHRRNVVLINAGAALMAADKADTLRDGIFLSEEAIDSGNAMAKLEGLARYTTENA
ncbi:anthranilate phosphoribosyltransferase [Desulfoluna butyratoxydans]|uniref:Anthranilate phosphoribosyltransferase n=1 Tax=Desulfoluna butyratoxydans TaxID=231438 RepID=A0A4U8YSY8_9BACT|nr:anthranilate phosphoribosyltransferase [Desulfoluna butyratoxydans]VFQ46469.1 anthranilate phosphoribosyl transferase [Desulfoluna butyratoxydans]